MLTVAALPVGRTSGLGAGALIGGTTGGGTAGVLYWQVRVWRVRRPVPERRPARRAPNQKHCGEPARQFAHLGLPPCGPGTQDSTPGQGTRSKLQVHTV